MKKKSRIPLVSVYIPTYNRSSLLNRAVKSVLSQTIKNIEVIIVDDNSTDDTFELISKLKESDNRVIYLKNNKNMGACFNRNRAISEARGKFVTGLDDDDFFLPMRLENFINYWEHKNPDAIALFSNKIVKYTNDIESTYDSKNLVSFNDLCLKNQVGNQIFTLKSTLNKFKYDEGLSSWQDLDLWFNILNSNRSKLFENTKLKDHIIDKSHPHERISNKKVLSYMDSFMTITQKYNFSEKEKYKLKCQVYAYDTRKFGLYKVFNDSMKTQNIYVVLRMTKYFLFNKRSF